jgi:hypothetical protein
VVEALIVVSDVVGKDSSQKKKWGVGVLRVRGKASSSIERLSQFSIYFILYCTYDIYSRY